METIPWVRYRTHVENHPERCQDLGPSASGQHRIVARRIGRALDVQVNLPAVRFIGCIHGDETIGYDLTLDMVKELEATGRFLDCLDIWVIPVMNPDGFFAEPQTRNNGNNKDLNRSFPHPAIKMKGSMEPEVDAIIRWTKERKFTFSCAIHTGAVISCYPWDGPARGRRAGHDNALPRSTVPHYKMYGTDMPCPDPNIKRYSDLYCRVHSRMKQSVSGAHWYVIYGSMGDCMMRDHGLPELTLELRKAKREPRTRKMKETWWRENQTPIWALLESIVMDNPHKQTNDLETTKIDSTQPSIDGDRMENQSNETFQTTTEEPTDQDSGGCKWCQG